MTSPKPTLSLIAPLPRPGDIAIRRDDAIRALNVRTANRLLYVSSVSLGLVYLMEADGSVINTGVAWAGVLVPQVGDAVVRIAIPGRGDRDAAPTYVAVGPIHRADDGPGVVEREGSATNALVTSNASTSTYVTALSVGIPLGPGTWEIVADGDLALTHSAGAGADVQVVIDGVATSRASQSLSASVWSRWSSSRRQTGVAGNRVVTVTLEYKPRAIGTAGGSNPKLRIRAIRLV